jgi:CBS domain-containing protein
MKIYGYTAIPVISEDGTYVGCVSEGDFLWHIIATGDGSMKLQEQYKITDILRPNYNPAVRVDVDMDTLLERSLHQNFIPVTDDRDVFIGIVTRHDIIEYFTKEKEKMRANEEIGANV